MKKGKLSTRIFWIDACLNFRFLYFSRLGEGILRRYSLLRGLYYRQMIPSLVSNCFNKNSLFILMPFFDAFVIHLPPAVDGHRPCCKPLSQKSQISRQSDGCHFQTSVMGSIIFPFDRRLSLRYYNFRKYLSSPYKTHRRHRQREHPSKHLRKGLVWM